MNKLYLVLLDGPEHSLQHVDLVDELKRTRQWRQTSRRQWLLYTSEPGDWIFKRLTDIGAAVEITIGEICNDLTGSFDEATRLWIAARLPAACFRACERPEFVWPLTNQ